MHTESVAKSILFAYSVNMGAIKGIILDKDGTLFDYGVVWGPVLSAAISRGLAKANMPNERKNECIQDFCRIVGVDGDGKTYPDGIIFRHDKLLRATMRVLSLTFHYRMNPWRVWKSVKGLLNHEDFGLSERLEHMEFPYVKEVIKAMHYRGYIIGIVTTDTTISTELFLKKMGITEKEKLTSILAQSTNIRYMIVDTIDNIKSLSYEVWFKGNASLSEGIWLGNGIANQFTLKVTTNSRILRAELDQNFGYVIKKGKATLVKFVSEE